MMTQQGRKDGPGQRRLRFLPLAAILVCIAFGYAMGWQDLLSATTLVESRETLKGQVAADPVLSASAFVLLYAVAVALSFPAPSALTVVGGFLFGWLAGAACAIVAATAGATVIFLAARSAFGGFLTARAGSAAARLAEGFERDAFGYLLVLRIAPFVPFQLVNLAPALANVRLKTFLAATLIGILPGALTYSWLGEGLDDVLLEAGRAGRDPRLSDLVTPEITIGLAALALVAALATIVRKAWLGRHPGTGRDQGARGR